MLPRKASDSPPDGAGAVSSRLSLRLFGPFEARVDGVPLPRLRSRRGEWLLALLALRAGQEIERHWLAGVLWPESSQAQARTNLRVTLKDLRRALGPAAGCLQASAVLFLSLDLGTTDVDVVDFDRAVAQGDANALERAVALHRGPLLEDCGEEWAFQERLAREQAYLSALETLAATARSAGNPAAAEEHLRRATAVDPLRETAQRALMQALAAGGNYAAALQVSQELRLELHRQLNAAPDPETQALFERLRAEARGKAVAGRQSPAASQVKDVHAPLTVSELASGDRRLATDTVTFLFADIAGSTRLWEQHPEAMPEALARHEARLRQAIEAHDGTLFKTVGDQCCAAFPTAPAALHAALAAQQAASGVQAFRRSGVQEEPTSGPECLNA